MSQAYLGRSARSLNQSVYSGYSTGTAASQGRIVRRSPAPRFHPFIIIVAVICVGMVIVGLVMTIIANWPGYSSIGFNALEIVGPVILGVGALALICTIVVVVMRNKYQKEEWEMKMIDAERSRAIWASRTTMEPQTPTASIGKPSKSILKKTPSTSTYGRDSNVFEEGSDSGVAAYTPNHVNNSYEPESDASDSNKPHHVYKIETMPDPSAARNNRHGSNHAPYREQHSTDSESHVPVPIRVPKAKKSRSQTSQPQYAQEAYATQEPPLTRGSPLIGTPDVGGMSDRLSYTSDQEIVASPTTPTSHHAPQPKVHRPMQNYEHQRSYDAFDPNSGQQQPGFQPPVTGYEQPAGPTSQGDATRRHKSSRSRSRDEAEPQDDDLDRNNEARRSRRKKKKKPAAEGEGLLEGTPGAEYAKPRKHKKRSHAAQPTTTSATVPAQQSSPTLTRINIHAQPGTSVSITPGGPQYQAPPRHNVSKEGSVETEI